METYSRQNLAHPDKLEKIFSFTFLTLSPIRVRPLKSETIPKPRPPKMEIAYKIKSFVFIIHLSGFGKRELTPAAPIARPVA